MKTDVAKSPTIFRTIALAASLVAGAACSDGGELRDLGTIQDFKARFNIDAGKPRLLLLLSPT